MRIAFPFSVIIILIPVFLLLSGCQISSTAGRCSNLNDERMVAACEQLEEQCPASSPDCDKYWKNFEAISKNAEMAAAKGEAMQDAKSGDWSSCGDIEREVEQSICYQAASKTKEPEDCATLQVPYSYSCYSIVASAKKDKSICENIPLSEQERIAPDVNPPQMVPLRDLCYQGVAAQKGDLADCDELGTLKYECYKNVAIVSKDSSLCAKIPEDAKRPGYEDFLQDGCYSFFADYMPESADCSGMPDAAMKDKCYGSLARSAKALDELKEVCLKIKDLGKRNMCYYFGALDLKDMEICRLVADEFSTNEVPSQCVCFREFMGRYNFDCSTVAADLRSLCNEFKSSGFCSPSECSSDADCEKLGKGLVCEPGGRCANYICSEDGDCTSKFGANSYCLQMTTDSICQKYIFTPCSTDKDCSYVMFCNKEKCMCRPNAGTGCNDDWLTPACEDIEDIGFRRMCYQQQILSGSMDCETVSPDFKDECIASKVGCPPYTYYMSDGTCGCLKDSDCNGRFGPGNYHCINDNGTPGVCFVS